MKKLDKQVIAFHNSASNNAVFSITVSNFIYSSNLIIRYSLLHGLIVPFFVCFVFTDFYPGRYGVFM